MIKKILLISDFCGYGKVALSAVTPVLVRQRYEIFSLPTLMVSNTLNYGKFASLDTTEYMKESIKTWKELGFMFDAVCVGYIANDAQADFILDFCMEQSKLGALIFVDPIMADDGKLYNSITEHRVDIMKKIISIADYIVPNMTEAGFLSGIAYSEEGYSLEELKDMTAKLHKSGAKSVIITSALTKDETGSHKAVIGYDNDKDDFFTTEYEEIPIKINGSGDTFLAFFMAGIIQGKDMKSSVNEAVSNVRNLIMDNMDIAKEYNGLPIEASF